AALLAALAFPGPAQGWSGEAHRAAAAVTTDLLCAGAAGEMATVLGDWSVEEAVVWPDRVRDQPRWAHTRDWHYMNIEDEVPVTRDAPVDGGRILPAIRANLELLGDASLPTTQRRRALAFALHLVVDLHQPLHVGRAADRGGNAVRVRFEDREINLHQLWDGRLLSSSGLRAAEYARTLAPLAELGRASWSVGTLEDWADESRRLRPWVYDFDQRRSVPRISRRYAETGRQLVAVRLAQAAVRSAQLLNDLWCPSD
ncbi:MAG: S1/P1 nuclease, partial [Gammaproteobacteria bacterium]